MISMEINNVYCGDCAELMQQIDSGSIDLTVTSPPYANRRKAVYGGVDPECYVEWFLPISAQLYRILKPTGSFILNIKENVLNGERSIYVLELILALRKQGWLWTEEYIWHKKNAAPGKWPNRFRDSWERCLHFTKQRKFAMYQEAVMIPIGEWAKTRLLNPSGFDMKRHNSSTGSGIGTQRVNWKHRNYVYPTNVLHLAAETRNVGHSAAFPSALPEWFIKLFTCEGDTVFDPMCGSGTTLRAAKTLGRNYLGIDISEEYCELSRRGLEDIVCKIINSSMATA